MEKHSSTDFQNGGLNNHTTIVDVASLEEFSDLLRSQHEKLHSDTWRRHKIQKLPPQIRRRPRRGEPVYDPVMVSLGPYHHGKPELRLAEEFKHLCLDFRCGGDAKKKAFLFSMILREIAEIRESYSEVKIVEKFDDKSLAMMMLLDVSIIIDFIHTYLGMKGSSFLSWQRCLGARSGPLMVRDMMVLENQIPFFVIKLVIGLQYDEEEAALFLPRFMSQKIGINLDQASIPREYEDPPLHFLEAFRRVLVKKHKNTNATRELRNTESRFLLSGFSMKEEVNKETDISYAHRSATDLKSKGVRVKPNSTRSIQDISFESNACFSHLSLPVQYVSDLTPVVCANMIAFEVLPNGISNLVVLSYAMLMKSLIQSSDDVKELQERGVLLNRVVNRERVVEIFKEIETFGLLDEDVFKDVKREVEEHCRNQAKTWFAELVYTRFRTPWTAMAFLAAGVLLCLTFLQTFFTISR